jgi:hypothetical protein
MSNRATRTPTLPSSGRAFDRKLRRAAARLARASVRYWRASDGLLVTIMRTIADAAIRDYGPRPDEDPEPPDPMYVAYWEAVHAFNDVIIDQGNEHDGCWLTDREAELVASVARQAAEKIGGAR